MNISWFYNTFQYPSIIIALATIVYSFMYVLNGKSKTSDYIDEMLFYLSVGEILYKYSKVGEKSSFIEDGEQIE